MSVDTPIFDSESISARPRQSTPARGGDIEPENATPRKGGYQPEFGRTPEPDAPASPRLGGNHLEGTQMSDVVPPAPPRISKGSHFDPPTH